MITPKNFSKLPQNKKEEIISEIMRNAYGLYSDAQKLICSGSCGHAISLLILAREEAIKASVLESPDSAPYATDLRQHQQKQKVLETQTFGRNSLIDMVQLIERNLAKLSNPSMDQAEQAFNDALREYLQIVMGDPTKKQDYEKMRIRYQIRQRIQSQGSRLKNRGLYVDVRNNGIYRSPSDMDEKLAKDASEVTIEDIFWTDKLCNGSKLAQEYGIQTPYKIV